MNPLNFYRGKPKFPPGNTNENPDMPVKTQLLNYGINLVHDNSRIGLVMNFVIFLL